MTPYYTSIIFITVFCMLSMVVITRGNHMLPKNEKLWFTVIFSMIALEAVMEWLGVALNGKPPFLRPLHIAVKVAEFSLAPIIPLLCTGIIGFFRKNRWAWAILLAHTALELLSARFGFIFYVDAANMYYREAYYWIYVLSFLMGIVVFLVELFLFGRTYQSRNMQGMVMIVLFLTAGLIPQFRDRDIRTIWLCVAITASLYYVFYSELIQQVDVLTTLLGRRCYEVHIRDLRRPAVLLSFDVNGFKNINDTYGHPFGDVCLRVIGMELKACYGRYGRCYRVGGDEFCVILQKGLNEVGDLNAEFFQRMRLEREREPRLPRIAVGHVRFDPARDNIAEAVQRADDMMYQCKRKDPIYAENARSAKPV